MCELREVGDRKGGERNGEDRKEGDRKGVDRKERRWGEKRTMSGRCVEEGEGEGEEEGD